MLAFDRAWHAQQAEEIANKTLKQKTVELERVNTTLSLEREVAANYTKAEAVLSPLVTEQSLEGATRDALTTIRERVSDIFARIHSPAEYELGDLKEGLLLINRDDKKAHGINQVSTGQRAALALSIFLALNGSAASAPPVLLIDDPIAHIDDLNSLSFLDYLRDLVLDGPKQVFFATADARLAALFQRKFEFLGQPRFQRIPLT